MQYILTAIALATFLVGCDVPAPTTTAPTTTEAPTAPAPDPEPTGGVTMEAYSAVQTGEGGSTLDEVRELFGGDGELMSESDIAGIKTEIWMWQGSGIANVNVTFQNGVAISKAQFGL
jgi:hypothetical protein